MVYFRNEHCKNQKQESKNKKDISTKYYPVFIAQSRRLLRKLPSGTSKQGLAKYKQDNWGEVQQ